MMTQCWYGGYYFSGFYFYKPLIGMPHAGPRP